MLQNFLIFLVQSTYLLYVIGALLKSRKNARKVSYFDGTIPLFTLCYLCPTKKSKNAAKCSYFDCTVTKLTLCHWCPSKKSEELKNAAKLT